MSFVSKKTSVLWGVFVCIAALALSGCGYSGEDACDDKCDCTGCSDLDYDNCIDDAGDLERQVAAEGCDGQYSDYLDCYGSEFRCVQSKVDADGCNNEFTSLLNCLAN